MFASTSDTGATCEHGTNIMRGLGGRMSDWACANHDVERHS